MRCLNCNALVYDRTAVETIILCEACKKNNKVTIETYSINKDVNLPSPYENNDIDSASMRHAEISNIDVGAEVKFNNEDHIWHEKIVKIVDKKHKFVRILHQDEKLWVPNEWVKRYEIN